MPMATRPVHHTVRPGSDSKTGPGCPFGISMPLAPHLRALLACRTNISLAAAVGVLVGCSFPMHPSSREARPMPLPCLRGEATASRERVPPPTRPRATYRDWSRDATVRLHVPNGLVDAGLLPYTGTRRQTERTDFRALPQGRQLCRRVLLAHALSAPQWPVQIWHEDGSFHLPSCRSIGRTFPAVTHIHGLTDQAFAVAMPGPLR